MMVLIGALWGIFVSELGRRLDIPNWGQLCILAGGILFGCAILWGLGQW